MASEKLQEGEVCLQIVDSCERFYAVSESRLKEIYAMPLSERRPALMKAVRPYAVFSTGQCLYTLVLDGDHDEESWEDEFGDDEDSDEG